MQEFKPAHLEDNPDKSKAMIAFIKEKFPHISDDEVADMMADARIGDVFMNDTYTVIVRDAEIFVKDFPEMIWISIKRNDRQPIHDWRDLQDIKNIFAGEENEAVELYPANTRVVDTANQYHIWAFKSTKAVFPFGFPKGFTDYTPEKSTGAIQRPKT